MDIEQYTKEFLEAYNIGRRFAYRIRVGKKFFGSMPIAKKLYKSIDNHHAMGFMSGFHNALKFRSVCVSPQTGLVTGFVDDQGGFYLQ